MLEHIHRVVNYSEIFIPTVHFCNVGFIQLKIKDVKKFLEFSNDLKILEYLKPPVV